MLRILVVEDDEGIQKLLKIALEKNGYQVIIMQDGVSAVQAIEKNDYDLVLLDVMLPGLDGFSVMEYIQEFDIPVIFLTARAAVNDKVKGLRMGAEDYIVKPFDILELQARIENVLRRHHKLTKEFTFKDINVDTEAHKVFKQEQPIELTLKEYELLLLFLRNRGIVLYRENIYERVWQEPYLSETRTVDLHVQRLRKKLGLEDCIKSVPKIGYRME